MQTQHKNAQQCYTAHNNKFLVMNRKSWLLCVLIFLLLILGWFWYWFLRYECDDSWCLVLDSRKADLAVERSILDNTTIQHPAKANTAMANEANIQVTAPTTNQTVSSPLALTGKAREFENVFNYRVKDADGTILGQNHLQYTAEDAGSFGYFSVHVSFDAPTSNHGTIEVFALSARDGSEIDKITIPVQFQ